MRTGTTPIMNERYIKDKLEETAKQLERGLITIKEADAVTSDEITRFLSALDGYAEFLDAKIFLERKLYRKKWRLLQAATKEK